MSNWIRRSLVAALLACGIAAGAASAGISSISGQIVQIAPPPSVSFDGSNGALESNDHMFVFQERQNVMLTADLPTDISQPGTYGPDCGCNPLTPGTIPGGTVVSSIFVHADPVGEPSQPNVLRATVVTDSDILGIEVCGNARPHCGVNGLDISDPILGAPGTIYPTNVFGRSMNFATQQDALIWMIDKRTVMIQTATRDHADQVRIITKGNPGTIIVKKITDPSPDLSNSSFTFTGDAAGQIRNGQTITVGNLAPGTYHSTEVVPNGWQLESISCDDSNSTGNTSTATATFHAEAGETVTCTFVDGEKTGLQGCTPGYWKQPQHFHSWVGLSPSDSFEAVFGVDAFPGTPSLLTVLGQGGGGVNALGRMAVSALLNALSPSVAYPITSGQVITQTRNAILSHNAATIESLKNQFDSWNNLNCTLN
jgi:hypothetical protein